MGNTRTKNQTSNKRGRPKMDGIACIFVHAGAGYHSTQNEHIHLRACDDASRAAMALMIAGGSATDAVEMAIKVLEDREITNAGYGSNLAIDGTVECDAVIVDHNGRSGGVGAVAQIKNPITLARLLLDKSATQLSLRRVPPNFLVGQGATDFAWSHGLPVVPHNMLVSPAARERWRRWKIDLRAAENKKNDSDRSNYGTSPTSSEVAEDLFTAHVEQESSRRAHQKAMEQGLFNDAQPMSPPPTDMLSYSPRTSSLDNFRHLPSYVESQNTYVDPRGPDFFTRAPSQMLNPTQARQGTEIDGSHCESPSSDDEEVAADTNSEAGGHDLTNVQFRPANAATNDSEQVDADIYDSHTSCALAIDDLYATDNVSERDFQRNLYNSLRSDDVQDTVGAIAIDMYGHIACGASSGGIGMKHRGRVGPAALVGIGACVISANVEDPERTYVATVTSGTGEHMATTQAASVCSHRVYNSQRVASWNQMEDVHESEAVIGFIEKDFMEHPSVQKSTSAGAIGVMSVKQTKEGAWIYFAHNTDSFALASMSSNDERPQTTMSRSKGDGRIADGGRAIRFGLRR